ncbi:hypothetical protein J6590_079271 [Homalodisca vitripennis]|nr:hypothetical protein J6590_079271 [Homalodisca vitripennis]
MGHSSAKDTRSEHLCNWSKKVVRSIGATTIKMIGQVKESKVEKWSQDEKWATNRFPLSHALALFRQPDCLRHDLPVDGCLPGSLFQARDVDGGCRNNMYVLA